MCNVYKVMVFVCTIEFILKCRTNFKVVVKLFE